MNDHRKVLQAVMDRAVAQSCDGKGLERHGSKDSYFEDQPATVITGWLGSNHGLLFQAIKKTRESVRLSRADAINELLGAIVYLAMAVAALDLEAVQPSAVQPSAVLWDMRDMAGK